ncbi:head scaffolding protein [Mycobacterium phage Indlulamithi]|uniref:Scaffolding protein n=1 Tax=Mycobacterium phage Indlulamithi TaxID=2656582 RepID=A0A649VCI1_9CAUD|nr:head scaffolding protein [Mycobacterium phage Indlulamithi]QGJ90051.1 scaffolding protein [Mycobacterium phage Indlulamithi]
MQSDTNFALWPIPPYGFEDGDGSGNEGGDGTGDQNNGGDSNSGQQQQNSGQQQNNNNDDDDDDPYKGLSAKELKRRLKDEENARKSAEGERDSAKQTLTQKEREKMDENDRLKAEKQDDANTIAELRATNAKLLILGAIRDDSRFEWHNPEIVAQQFNSDEVKVDPKTGKIEGIAKALARVAKDHEYLLKSQKKNDSKDQQRNNSQQQQNNGQSHTGFQPGQGGASQGGNVNADDAKLAELMPALRSRL